MNAPSFDSIIQGASLLALAAAVFYSARQARSAEKLAKVSLEQTELMRAQLHAAFRPVVEVTGGEYGINCAMLTLRNVGTSPALALSAVCRNGWREKIGSLAPEGIKEFRFDNSYNMAPPPPVGPPEYRAKFKVEIQPVPLRLEYRSVSGAQCWTTVDFSLGHEGTFQPECDSGWDEPSLSLNS